MNKKKQLENKKAKDLIFYNYFSSIMWEADSLSTADKLKL